MTTSTTISTYRITASFTRDGQTQASDTAETLGEAYQRTYADRDDAESACEDLQASVAEYGLRPSTAYSVVEDSHEIEIGDVVEEYTTEDDDGDTVYPELDAYVQVRVKIDGARETVACGLGIRESEQGSARASGCGVRLGNGPDAWWVDSSDHQGVPEALREAVLEALDGDALSLWQQTMAKRPVVRPEVTLTLGRDGMGDNADEADFDAWVSYVTDRINEESDCDVTVEVRGPRDVQDDDIRGGDERMPGCAPGYDGNAAVGDAMTRLWEAFCADDSAWPKRDR
jgi:hypothetical protein